MSLCPWGCIDVVMHVKKEGLCVNDTSKPHLFIGCADNSQEKETGLDLL